MLKDMKLDDRTFQQIVDEMRKRIPFYCPEWTDHNVSDPGITLLELFAWMMEILLFRVNQVPDLHTIRFLELLGLHYESPRAAQGRVTFWLSEPFQGGALVIGDDVEVATTQTETEAPEVFRVIEPFPLKAPKLATVIAQERGGRTHAKFNLQQTEEADRLRNEGVDVFCAVQEEDALYLGFSSDLSHHVLRLTLEVEDLRAAGGGRSAPPYQWQAHTAQGWVTCPVKDGEDRTENMNHTNYTQFALPALQATSIEGITQYWIRVELQKHRYKLSPRLFRVVPVVIGCSVLVRHEQKVENEQLGAFDGAPDQRFFLQHKPLLARAPGEHLLVDDEKWEEVPDFADSAATLPERRPKKHYMLDSATGELRFGPAIRQRDGSVKQYGQIPPRHAKLKFSRYRYGGGLKGNLAPGKINTLKSSLSFIKRVENLEPIIGGLDQETLEELAMRATRLLRGSQRAVTAEDFAWLAQNEYNRRQNRTMVARAKCVAAEGANPAQPGQVELLVVPYVPADPFLLGRLLSEKLVNAFELLNAPATQSSAANRLAEGQSLYNFIKERCLVTTNLKVTAAEYQWVAVHVNVQAPEAQRARWEEQLLTKLYRFLNPVTGGAAGEGWPWGAALQLQDLYDHLRGGDTAEIGRRIREISIFKATPDGASYGQVCEEVPISSRTVIASGQHVIRFL
ncbi:MAG: putative baseplate assembly protein [Caldilinea sp. CFX5]|nr:putative baseplate assembly protein [Caldilinea sp. CFX5]